MDVAYFKEPVPHIIFTNLFSKVVNKGIINEVISYKDRFQSSGTGNSTKPNPSVRTNTVFYMDNVDRNKSLFLTSIDRLFRDNNNFREILTSSPAPINEFLNTNSHETQISRYGDEGQRYDWHLDGANKSFRKLSFVYYFWKEPKKFKGGTLELTSSPVFDGQTVEELDYKNHITMVPINNMAVVFGGKTAHRVSPTTSPTKFEDGRFSANIWIGSR